MIVEHKIHHILTIKEWIRSNNGIMATTQEAINAIQKIQRKYAFKNTEVRQHCRHTINILLEYMGGYLKDKRRYDKTLRRLKL